ncbi:MAG: S41 family peptidase [Aureispira sp.]|nr:S41 family peptidase [Aureispira sp.]
MKKWWLFLLITLSMLMLSTDQNRFFRISKSLEMFADTYRVVNNQYVDKTDPNKLMRIAIDTMLKKLDPYTNYFSEAEMEQLRIGMKGGWDGIGVEITKHKGAVLINELVEGTPAHEKGIEIGDVLLSIDGVEITERKVKDIENLLHGKLGTQLTIKIKRPITGKEEEITLARTKVVKKNVPYHGMLNDTTAYIVLTTFTERAAANIADAFKELQEDYTPKQLILDLRDNGGGLLIEAVNICNLFVQKGLGVVSTRNKIADWDRSFRTLNQPIDTKIPIAILINGRSASASEIVAGALQDFDRALLIGRKSFGKGLVQNVKDIGYSSRVKLTTAKYYIPSGRCIQALEYEDGQAVKIADSLKTEFKTANGRVVYDGTGLFPDYEVAKPKESAIVKSLKKKLVFFAYANAFYAENDSIVSAADFEVTDALFEDFVSFIKKEKHTYVTSTERELKKIKAQAKREGHYDVLKPTLSKMEKQIVEDKAQDLKKHEAEIKRLLKEEIVSRYYFERGVIEARLSQDIDIDEAINLFADKKKFKSLLAPPK